VDEERAERSADSQKGRAVRLAAAFGIDANAVSVLDGGNQNHVVRLATGGRDLVVRFARDGSRMVADPFDVEAWCAQAITASMVMTPEVIERGHVDGVSVLIQAFVSGTPAAADDLAAWRAVGRIAAALSVVDTSDAPESLFSRFGRDLGQAWAEHIDYNIHALDGADPLLELGVYEVGQLAQLRTMLGHLRSRHLVQGLVHGDLSTRNLIAVDGGQYVVVDWGSAQTGPTPWADLELIHRWWVTGDRETRVSRAAWDAVLVGAGLTAAYVDPILRELSTLHALDVVRWARDVKPDRLPQLVAQSTGTIRRSLSARALR